MLKQIGKGAVLAMADSSDSTTSGSDYIRIAAIRSISHSGGGGADVDTFCLDSTGNFRTFMRGPVDPGSLTLDMVFSSTDTTHKKLGTSYKTGNLKWWFVHYPSTTTTRRKFNGYVSDVGEEIPLDDLIMQSVTIKISGTPNFATT